MSWLAPAVPYIKEVGSSLLGAAMPYVTKGLGWLGGKALSGLGWIGRKILGKAEKAVPQLQAAGKKIVSGKIREGLKEALQIPGQIAKQVRTDIEIEGPEAVKKLKTELYPVSKEKLYEKMMPEEQTLGKPPQTAMEEEKQILTERLPKQ